MGINWTRAFLIAGVILMTALAIRSCTSSIIDARINDIDTHIAWLSEGKANAKTSDALYEFDRQLIALRKGRAVLLSR